jgi:Phosphopantetheine attachment site
MTTTPNVVTALAAARSSYSHWKQNQRALATDMRLENLRKSHAFAFENQNRPKAINISIRQLWRHCRKSCLATMQFMMQRLILKSLSSSRDPFMSLRSTITAQFEQVALEQKRKLARLSDDLKLLESGLDSLSFALIVARLEDAVGFDPFDSDEEMRFPVTFGDFVRLYDNHPK